MDFVKSMRTVSGRVQTDNRVIVLCLDNGDGLDRLPQPHWVTDRLTTLI